MSHCTCMTNTVQKYKLLEEEKESVEAENEILKKRISESESESTKEVTEKFLFEVKCKLEQAQIELIQIEHKREEERIEKGIVQRELEIWKKRAHNAEDRNENYKARVIGLLYLRRQIL